MFRVFRKAPLPIPTETEPAPPPRFVADSIVHTMMPEGGRSLDQYERKLNFRREALAGKHVLDLGAGPEVKFARGIAELDMGATVVSLSPSFAEQQYLERARAAFPNAILEVGLGEELPFEDNSFDVVLALHVSEHVTSEARIQIATEIGRVLRATGWAKFGPLQFGGPTQTMREAVLSGFPDKRFSVVEEVIPTDVVQHTRYYDAGNMKHRVANHNFVINHESILGDPQWQPGPRMLPGAFVGYGTANTLFTP